MCACQACHGVCVCWDMHVALYMYVGFVSLKPHKYLMFFCVCEMCLSFES